MSADTDKLPTNRHELHAHLYKTFTSLKGSFEISHVDVDPKIAYLLNILFFEELIKVTAHVSGFTIHSVVAPENTENTISNGSGANSKDLNEAFVKIEQQDLKPQLVFERVDPLRGLPPRLAEKWKLVISGVDRAAEDKDDYEIYCIQEAYDKINSKSLPKFTLTPVKAELPKDMFEIRFVYEHGNAIWYTHERVGIPNREGCWTVNDFLSALNAPEAKLPVTHGRYEWWAESNVEYFRVPLDLTTRDDTYAKLYSYDIYYYDPEGKMFKVDIEQSTPEKTNENNKY